MKYEPFSEFAEKELENFQIELNEIKGFKMMKYSYLPIIMLFILLSIQLISIIFNNIILEIISFVIAVLIILIYFTQRIVAYYFQKQIRKIKEKYRWILYKVFILRERTKILRWNAYKIKKDLRGFKFEVIPYVEEIHGSEQDLDQDI